MLRGFFDATSCRVEKRCASCAPPSGSSRLRKFACTDGSLKRYRLSKTWRASGFCCIRLLSRENLAVNVARYKLWRHAQITLHAYSQCFIRRGDFQFGASFAAGQDLPYKKRFRIASSHRCISQRASTLVSRPGGRCAGCAPFFDAAGCRIEKSRPCQRRQICLGTESFFGDFLDSHLRCSPSGPASPFAPHAAQCDKESYTRKARKLCSCL